MHLGVLTRPSLIYPQLDCKDSKAVLHTFARRLAALGPVVEEDELFEKLSEREQLCSTGIGNGVAVPHCKLDGLEEIVLSVCTLQKAIGFSAVDGQEVWLFFCVLSPSQDPAAHLQCLAAISRWVSTDGDWAKIRDWHNAAAIYRQLTGESL